MQKLHEFSGSNDHQCADGRCPPGIDSVKKIGLTQKEKRAIFFSLKKEIKKSKLHGDLAEPLKG